MNSLVVIPARGGSKGLPGKNIKLLNGKPLIHYTIEAARRLFKDIEICFSTDDNEIKKVAEQTGLSVPFLRPKELANDDSGTHEVLLHAIKYYKENFYKPDVIILLQPTSPFRTSDQIKEAINIYTKEKDIDMIVSVKETKSNPYYILFEENQKGFLEKSKKSNINRRQDCPKVWELNGAIYIISANSLHSKSIQELKKIKKYVMDDYTSHDIDNLFDWEIALTLLNKHKKNIK